MTLTTRHHSFIGRVLQASLVGFILLLATAAGRCEDPAPEDGPVEWVETTPDGFVKVDPRRPHVWRAVAADGSAIGVRHRDNDEDGDLAFWTEVFEREMTLGKGYRLAETTDIESGDGVAGKLLHLELAEQSRPYHYGLAVYVTEESLVTVETAAELEALEAHGISFDAVRTSVNVRAGEREE